MARKSVSQADNGGSIPPRSTKYWPIKIHIVGLSAYYNIITEVSNPVNLAIKGRLTNGGSRDWSVVSGGVSEDFGIW